ncbi:NAD(P)-dependent alcohol dehydrogenase [Pseudolysinimonas yzui]|uniref:Alcohol dehydrogenase n=1 Tax=Pseudolysinimonas yzui TaxID=2708254 RepID=A0A8J3GNJ8_9MICO|nr:NAD(P)-dependent alcohol dehydrogenase [Pseudolysinimonas yzui]GHF07588.1 alcohol dehydrogenase [Pseudolysinimonas yzui]
MSPEAGTTMRAAVYRRFGGPEVVHVENIPRPQPKADEVLIRVHASTVSVADYRSRSLDLPPGLGFFGPLSLGIFGPRRPVLGMDLAGVVEQVGSEVSLFAPGDEVVGLRGFRFGAHAEYAVMRETAAIARKPANLTFDEAVCLVFGGLTARGFLSQVELPAGADVLVNGASGSTGSAAVQIARAMGAHVTGVSSARNHDLVRSLGADEVIDYATTDFAADGKTYDVIVDAVGNAPFARVGASIKPGGALLLVVGDLHSMLTARRDSRRSGKLVTMHGVPSTAADVTYLVELAEAGRFVPVIERHYGLDEIVEAHRFVGTGRKRGNLVLRLT